MNAFHVHIALLISLNPSTVSHKPLSIISIRNNNKITTVPTKTFDFATITINHKTTNRKISKATNKQINNKTSNRRISKRFNSSNIVRTTITTTITTTTMDVHDHSTTIISRDLSTIEIISNLPISSNAHRINNTNRIHSNSNNSKIIVSSNPIVKRPIMAIIHNSVKTIWQLTVLLLISKMTNFLLMPLYIAICKTFSTHTLFKRMIMINIMISTMIHIFNSREYYYRAAYSPATSSRHDYANQFTWYE